jgi:uncharacterized protein (TIGR03086 family)
MVHSSDATGSRASDTRTVTEPNVAELIQLGRDREAAELASAGGTSMDVLTQLGELGPHLGGVVANISPGQLENPSPCSAFTVRGVLEHMISGATAFAAAFRGVDAPEPDLTDVLAGFGPALGGLVDAIQSPGALDRTVQTPFGEMPGGTFARLVVLDGLVHGWDLATATGQAYAPPEELVEEVAAFAKEALPADRDPSTFADPVEAPASATPMERLAAFTGRRVAP